MNEKKQEEEHLKMNEEIAVVSNPLMPQLPEAIITDIHSRLPPTSLIKFRCVSKPWSILFDNPKLIDMIKFNFSIMIVYDNNMYSIDNKSLSSSILRDRIDHCPDDDDENEDDYSRIGLLDGVDEDDLSSNFSLWNPSTGDYKVIPSPPDDQTKGYNNSRRGLSTLIAYGFGYDSKSDDYKFSSSSSEDLIALHMTDELVRGIQQPKTNFKKCGYTTCIDVVDGCLSMLYSNVNLGFQVWLMEDYGKKESWTKLYNISKLTSPEMGRSGCLRRIKCLKSGDSLLEVGYNRHGPNRKALLLYDPKKKMSTTLVEDEDEYTSNSLSFHSYVKSSVSVSSSSTKAS
ncbi:uncharacterized protein LOC113295081 [Papaver somniferum]|uniref:uncharacterized protein LOC113295081 n=1 Tax=Papaver somniferum TaxID=3469 RepID=UPI000E6F83D9|nr:uncharacterized protein LOC113295081 [Papaver somniferum]